MIVRDFEPGDIEEVISVDVSAYRHQFSSEVSNKEMEFELDQRKDGYKDLRIAKDRAIVACDTDNKIAGYVQFGDNKDGSMQVRRIYVLPEFQGGGLGRELMNAVLRAIAGNRVYIEVWKDNKRAQKLYASLGFKPTGKRIPWTDHNGEIDGYEIEMVLE